VRFEEAICKQQKPDDRCHWPDYSIGHLVNAIMAIHDLDSAREFRDSYIKSIEDDPRKQPGYTPQQLADANIGWCFGEGMSEEDRAMWRSFGASHPVFGSMKENPTPEQALEAGMKAAQKE
jgi:hypothetical protein